MDERERERLLARIDRGSSTLGAELPETVEIGGETVALREFVFECERIDAVPEAQRDRIEELLSGLRRERLRRRQAIRDDEVDRETAESYVETIRGLERAISALEGLTEPEYAEAVRRERLSNARKLLSLVRQR